MKRPKKCIWRLDGKALLKHIAEKLGVCDSQVKKWMNQDKWNIPDRGIAFEITVR